MDPLFPELPENLNDQKVLSDDDLTALIADHQSAIDLIRADDEEFLKGLSGEEVIEQLTSGVAQMKALKEELVARTEAHSTYLARKEELVAELSEDAPDDEDEGEESDKESEEAPVEIVAEDEEVEEVVDEEERVLVTASAPPRFSRTPPAPAPERVVVSEAPTGAALVAAGEMSQSYPGPLDEISLANLVKDAAVHHGPHPKIDPPGKYRFGGPEHKIARANFEFPEDRTLTADIDGNMEKIRAVRLTSVLRQAGSRRRARRFRRLVRSAHPDLLDAELRHRGRAGVGFPSGVPGSPRRRERSRRDLHR